VPALELFRERDMDAQMLGETTWNSAGQWGFDSLSDWIQPVWSAPEAGRGAVKRADRCSQALKNDTSSIARAAMEIAWSDQSIPSVSDLTESSNGMNDQNAFGEVEERRSFNGFEFEHSDFSKKLCPEAKGHFCMLWGDHGEGGYDTQANGYIQGGQPMDDTFELISIYLDFEEALSQRSWARMKQAVRELRQRRTDMGYSKAEEREARRDQDF